MSTDEAARAYPSEFFQRTVEAWREAMEEADRVTLLLKFDRRLNPWQEEVISAESEAETRLIRAILCTSPEVHLSHGPNPERTLWPARGVSLGEWTYLAVPDAQSDVVGESSLVHKMSLVVMPRGAILDASVDLILPEREPGVEAKPEDSEDRLEDWLETVLSAARSLGRRETMRRIFEAPQEKRDESAQDVKPKGGTR